MNRGSLVLAILMLVSGCAAAFAVNEGSPDRGIRVLIADGQPSVKLTVLGGYRVVDSDTGKILSDSRNLSGVRVRALPKGISIAGVRFPARVHVYSDVPADLFVNDLPFRGHITLQRISDENLMVVNTVDVEEYLYGVLFHEVGSWWPMEALKAQAVASRTYALYQKKERTGKPFDVYNNQSSQMYGGAGSERGRSSDAVDATRGEVMTYEEKIFPTFFHATCGGVTRNASELWNIDLPPLRGGVECSSCWFSPHYSWKTDVGLRELEDLLTERGVWRGEITALLPGVVSPSGHLLDVVIQGPVQSKTILVKDLRLWVGPTVIRSEKFELSQSRGRINFVGRGWGHAVGMCQWGALGQAIVRKRYDEILEFYYPGSKLTKLY
ncbi:MAG: SpoIID/LytB domain-containing protein [Candidatus Omnitrophica bacterium]|nr:SpoIID/LytB domain-containing protein [Candidatus Omnitrophota bacterium]